MEVLGVEYGSFGGYFGFNMERIGVVLMHNMERIGVIMEDAGFFYIIRKVICSTGRIYRYFGRLYGKKRGLE